MITILGVPGAGKTTLSKLLSVREGISYFPEPVESNPYLTDYYRDPSKHAFAMQLFLVHSMFKHTQKAMEVGQCVMDMHMCGNDLFALLQRMQGTMSDVDYSTYIDISKTLKSMVQAPDLMVYLQCSPQVAVNRIMKRGRASELGASLKYWYDLNSVYEQWYGTYSDGRKLLINVDDLDFVNDETDEDYVLDTIMEALC